MQLRATSDYFGLLRTTPNAISQLWLTAVIFSTTSQPSSDLCYTIRDLLVGFVWVSWLSISADNLNAPDAIADFHSLNPDKPGPVDKLVAADYRGGRAPVA